ATEHSLERAARSARRTGAGNSSWCRTAEFARRSALAATRRFATGERPVGHRRPVGRSSAPQHPTASSLIGGTMQLGVRPDGNVVCLYDELIDLSALGKQHIRRASHVEPDAGGLWHVDLAPSGGPQLGPFPCRSVALQAERDWLETAGVRA